MKKQSFRRVPSIPAYLFFILTTILFAFCQSIHICAAEESSTWVGDEVIYSTLGLGSSGVSDAGNGKIKGHVFAQNSQAVLPNIAVFAQQANFFEVEVYEADSRNLQGIYPVTVSNTMRYQSMTDEEGAYTIGNLLGGTYKVWIETDNSIYTRKYFRNSSDQLSAISVNLADSATVSGIDFHLDPGGFIEGLVVKSLNVEPVSDITISAFYYGTEQIISSTKTNSDGTYLLQGIPSGKFTVKAERKPDFVDSYFGGTDDAASALPVTVTSGITTSSINFSLTSYGTLGGLVTDEDGTPLRGIRVQAFDFNAPVTRYLRPTKQTVSDADGTYLLHELLAGQYRISSVAVTTYVTEVYDNKSNSVESNAVNLSEGQTLTGINFSLAVGGTIQGLVTAEITGLPIANAKIEAIDLAAGNVVGHVFTNPMGKYSLSKLPTGSYLIQASSPLYVSKYFPNADDTITAQEVPTAAGMIRGNVDFQLAGTPVAHVGTISGILTSSSTKTPIDMACVNAFTILTNHLDGFDCSDLQGAYLIEGLPDGDYRLCSRAGAGFINECFDNISLKDSTNSTTVTIINGEGVSGIDFSLIELGSIMGSIYRARNEEAGEVDDKNLIKLGSYEIKNLAPGDYIIKIRTTGTGYIEKYHRDAATMGTSTVVHISDGQTLQQGIDFILSVINKPTLASISGKVTRSDHTGLSYMSVNALDPVSQEIIQTTYSGTEGDYLLPDLAPGSYLVQVATSTGKDYLPLYFSNAYTVAAAEEIEIAEGQQRSGIDFQMTTGASILGHVVIDPSGEAVAGVMVCASRPGQTVQNCSVTTSDGTYAILGLTPSMYAVYVETASTPHYKILAKEYYNDQEILADTDRIQVSEGQIVTGIRFDLSRLGKISGKVIDKQSRKGISGLRINLIDATSKALIPSLFAMSGTNGTYTIKGIPFGKYLLQALSSGTLYRGQYFDNTVNIDSAQILSLQAAQAVTNIDFALTAGGAITGSVVRADTSTPLPGILVHILEFNSGKGVVAGRTGIDGSYLIRSLASGNYKVYVPASQTIFQSQYFNGVAELGAAINVVVESGKESNSINFALEIASP